MRHSAWRRAAFAVLLAFAGVAASCAPQAAMRERPELGLFTSLPIYWAEAGNVAEALDARAPPHWARTALETRYRLRPLDTLGGAQLAELRDLLLAQPRPLAPEENVALDDWVRGGGHVLLFADPFLTERSRFALGDKRRPQDVVLLSPILARWGLELQFDEDQGDAERAGRIGELTVPVRLAGRLALRGGGEEARCRIADQGLWASCAIGSGSATIVADAALLEAGRTDRSDALLSIARRAFAR